MFKSDKKQRQTPRRNEAFAEIYVSSGSVAQTIPTGAAYTKITAFDTDGVEKRCDADVSNDKIVIYKPGVYRVVMSVSFISDTANVEFYGGSFVAGAQLLNCSFQIDAGAANDTIHAGGSGFTDVSTVTSDLDFRMRHDNGGNVDITIEYANLNIEYIGGN